MLYNNGVNMVDVTSRKYLESYFADEVDNPKHIQDKILIVMKQDGLMEDNGQGKYTVLKKRPLIEYLSIAFPKIKRGSLNRQLNNLLKDGVLKISTRYKTKPYVIKGRLYKSRWAQVKSTNRSKTDMLISILMGDDPQHRWRYITDCIANGYKPDGVDV